MLLTNSPMFSRSLTVLPCPCFRTLPTNPALGGPAAEVVGASAEDGGLGLAVSVGGPRGARMIVASPVPGIVLSAFESPSEVAPNILSLAAW